MNNGFSATAEWLSSENGLPEVRSTAAFVAIAFGDLVATRHLDEWSQTVRSAPRLSAYPLATWFAHNWWRLLWEPSTVAMRQKHEWRMAHEMPAAGYGFIWPRLIFDSDGSNVDAHCLPSRAIGPQTVKYLERFNASVPASEFERTLDRFISLVISRLDALNVTETELHALWAELNEERKDPEASRLRRWEARLGFDPDEAPGGLLQRLQKLMSEAGAAATEEVAPACAGDHAAQTFSEIVKLAKTAGVPGRISIKLPDFSSPIGKTSGDPEPWRWSKELARQVRKQVASQDKPITDNELAGLLGIQSPVLLMKGDEHPKPLGLAVRNSHPGEAKFIFRRMGRTARRFEAARFLADSIIAPSDDKWLPETDAKTVRQKAQRAFAAEFLCPIESLVEFLGGDYSSEAINDAADHFSVSTTAVVSQLQNNNVIGAEIRTGFE
jgi:hypothetical protein